jgi:flagellar hook-associated protein 2
MTSVGSSIVSALNAGSGIDVSSLVSSLVSAAREPKATAISNKQTLNNARISALASASSSLDTFQTALTSLLSGTGFSGQPVSNDASIVSVSAIAGGVPSGLPAQIEVKQLAAAQTLVSTSLSASTATVGLGTLTLTTASGSTPITINSTNNTLDGLAAAINDANAGVTASVVIDSSGARLVMKGQTGSANGFTLTPGTADADLQRFTFDGTSGGMTKKQDAADAIISIDNVEMTYDSNVIKTALPYVRIDLNKAAPGTVVTLASDEPTTTMRDLVTDFVTAYNTLRTALNDATAGGDSSSSGALAGDAGARDMMRQLARMTSTPLAAAGSTYRYLSDIGVSTNRDGTLKVDTDKLDAAIAANPSAVSQMLNPAVSSTDNPGLAGALETITTSIKSDTGALAASQKKYAAMKTSLTEELEKLDTQMSNYQERLTATYAKMETQLTAFKATQTYLEQQIAIWNGDSNS